MATHWQPSPAEYPVQGIDVSHHQGEIDWTAVRSAGVDFAYIKASEGGDHRDHMFAANWAGADNAGVRRGAYHFFTLCRSGEDQARNFLAAVPADDSMLPPAIDLEFVGNCAARPARAELLREVSAFIRLVERRLGKRVIIYVIADFDETYHIGEALDRPLWLRSLFREPRYGARPWTIWQVSASRRVPGIRGGVDWNVMRP